MTVFSCSGYKHFDFRDFSRTFFWIIQLLFADLSVEIYSADRLAFMLRKLVVSTGLKQQEHI